MNTSLGIKAESRSKKNGPCMRTPAFCICDNKDAGQLCGNRTADRRLCFRYTDSTINSKISDDVVPF